MSRIEADHLAREAIVYVRQSTVDQVNNNVESRRRQYGLVERARQLGWAEVSVIDDDLGRSGSGVSRPGFEKLLAAICEGRVGAVVSIEASRLARNGRDWHTLLEFCGLVGTLIADEDGVYDPRLPNDRLLLGMKGTMSEMELTILRQRAHEAQPARSDREGSGPSRPRGARPGLPEVRRDAINGVGEGVVDGVVDRRLPLQAPAFRAIADGRKQNPLLPEPELHLPGAQAEGAARRTVHLGRCRLHAPAPTLTAGRPVGRQSRTAESASGAVFASSGRNGTF